MNKLSFLTFLLFSTTFSTIVLAEDVTISHSPTDVYIGDSVKFTVTNPSLKSLKIFVDGSSPVQQCALSDCSFSLPNILEGVHMYYVSINDETTLGPYFFLARDKTCTTNSFVKIDPLYKISNAKEEYKIKILSFEDGLDTYRLEYVPPAANRYTGAFGQNQINIDPGQTKETTLSITPSFDVPSLSKFKVKVISDFGKKTHEACGYFFIGHSVKISTTTGGTSNPAPSFFDSKIPTDRSITITAKPQSTYDFEKWVMNGVTTTGSSETIKIDKDYTISLSFTPKKTSFCTDAMSFIISPSVVKPSSFFSASISGLTSVNCVGKTIIFTSGTNSIDSCVIDNTGKCSRNFASPSTTGSFTYEASLDRNSDGDYDDTSSGPEKIKSILTVSSSASPSCSLKTSKASDFRYADNLNYAVDASLFNLPVNLKQIKLKCDSLPESIVTIEGSDYSPPVKKLTCNFNSIKSPRILQVSVSGPELPECTAKIQDFFPPQLNDINLNRGWNLISPTFDKNESTNCQFTASIWKYDPSGNKYEEVNSWTKMEPGVAYWVKVADKCTIRFSGTSDKQITLIPGGTPGTTKWNMIGSGQEIPITRAELISKLSITSCQIVGGLWIFNTELNTYQLADTMLPGYGYWIKVKSTTTSGCGIQL